MYNQTIYANGQAALHLQSKQDIMRIVKYSVFENSLTLINKKKQVENWMCTGVLRLT